MSNTKKFEYDYWRPAVTVDNVVLSFDGNQLRMLLIRRGKDPYKDLWAFPGGFMDEHETLEEAAQRELKEETGLKAKPFIQIGTFSQLDRDPRGRTITTAFLTIVRPKNVNVKGNDDAAEACWFPVHNMPMLAFDHEEIFQKAKFILNVLFITTPVPFLLMNDTFTLPEMQRLFSEVYEREFDRRNFQKKFIASGMLSPVANDNQERSNAPVYYRFNQGGFYDYQKKKFHIS
ncbi:MAG: NUDIX hydrolase [Bacteroidales bacterium]|nr:NUDIX hydrolase [Bacteroidales bacterium]